MIYVVFLLLWSTATALPKGAPTKVCQTMLPDHGGGIPPQPSPSLFIVTTIRRPTDIIVTIKSPVEVAFQGFMLQARGVDGRLLGRFEPITPNIHTITCDGQEDSLTHSNTDSRKVVDTYWHAPDEFEGTVIFNATIAQNYATFWVGVESTPVEVSKRSLPQNFTPEPYTTTPRIAQTTPPHFTPFTEFKSAEEPTDLFYKGCGEVKNCFGAPAGCIDTQDCVGVVAVTVEGDRYIFEAKAKGAQWVGIGLSNDAKMGDDSVIECVNENGIVKAYMSRTTPRPRLGVIRLSQPQEGIQLLNGSNVDGSIYCRVRRDTVTTVNGIQYDLIRMKYNLLVAAGTSIGSDSVGFHDLVSEASSSAIFLSEIDNIAAASKLLFRLHGAFMVIAWFGTASTGMILARYFKKTWVGQTLWGKDIWFAWHRNLMVLTWGLTTLGFILIFVELKAWSSDPNPHAIIGLIVTILCFAQPIGAFFRPHPGTPKRPIFNRLHLFGGTAAHILAIAAIFLAVRLTKADLPLWVTWIIVAYVVFFILMQIIFTILNYFSERSSEDRGNSNVFAMKDLHGPHKKVNHSMVHVDAPYSSSRRGLLMVYVVGVGGLVIALVVIIAIAPNQ